jgi:YHS domain-containing protein
MESILWFLIIGALFFFMMRRGCGAHMGGHGGHGGCGGGHGGHGDMDRGAGSGKVKDPVCGMQIDKDQAYAMIQREGRQVYFCSENCQDKLKEDPKRYL